MICPKCGNRKFKWYCALRSEKRRFNCPSCDTQLCVTLSIINNLLLQTLGILLFYIFLLNLISIGIHLAAFIAAMGSFIPTYFISIRLTKLRVAS